MNHSPLAISPEFLSTAHPQAQGQVCCTANTLDPTALLHEIRHALQRLLDTGEPTVIDLMRLPLGPMEQAMLSQLLGTEEVEAALNAMGNSTVRETALAGVWWVEHFVTDDQSISRYIEITAIPAILQSQPEDMRAAVAKLTECLSQDLLSASNHDHD